jgi:hypothetical protein
MVVKSLHCRREKEIACVSCSATATQSCAQSLPKFQIIGFSAMIAENWEAWSRLMNDTFLDQPMKSVMKTDIAGEILQV